jgi:hypothetical protein
LRRLPGAREPSASSQSCPALALLYPAHQFPWATCCCFLWDGIQSFQGCTVCLPAISEWS